MKKLKFIYNEAKGTVWYGMHFYPGCAEYQEPDKPAYRVLLKEPALRVMDPTFAGCPVFVQHVDEIETDINELRKEADGWVVESFFNQADGKHWAKFITCSDRAEQAIKRGMRLSNCYLPTKFISGGTWNGISYEREITDGEYEHLAIVPNPRYEESVIMTPDAFKAYNEQKLTELTKLANHNNNKKGDWKMKLNWFKRQKVENSTELDGMCVILPKSHKEVFLEKLINEADEMEMKKDEAKMAHPDHMVEVNGEKMTVNELLKKHEEACNALEDMKKPTEEEKNDDGGDGDEGMENKYRRLKRPGKLNEEDEEEKTENEEDEDKEEKEAIKDAKKKNAKEKADRLRNASASSVMPEATVSLSGDKVALGKQLFGSSN